MLGGFELNLTAMSLVSLAGRDVPHLQHRLRLGRPPPTRDRDPALVRRDAKRSARRFSWAKRSSLGAIGALLGLVGGTAAGAASGRCRRRNDLVALRARECEAGRVGAAKFCASPASSDWVRSSFPRGFRRKRPRRMEPVRALPWRLAACWSDRSTHRQGGSGAGCSALVVARGLFFSRAFYRTALAWLSSRPFLSSPAFLFSSLR